MAAPPTIPASGFTLSPNGVRPEDHLIDYDKLSETVAEARPKLIIAGGSAYSRHINFKRFREIADSVGAYLMVDMAHYAGLIAAGVYPSPIPHAHICTTTTHKTLRGPRGGMILSNDEGVGQEDQLRRLPGPPGRSAHARHRGQGGGLRRGAEAGVQDLLPGGDR